MADAKTEVIEKVAALVASRFEGDWHAAFDWYASLGRINAVDLTRLLTDAGVGNRLTRSAWVRAVIEEMDGDHQCISWSEFVAVIEGK